MDKPIHQSLGIVLGPHDNSAVLKRLHQLLLTHGIDIIHEPDTPKQANDLIQDSHRASSLDDFAQRAQLICCIGGDGTMLDAIGRYYQYNKPFTGINLGRLGFLVDLSPDAIESSFAALLMGRSCSENRMMIEIEVRRDGKTIATQAAANEIFFRNAQGVSMIYLDVLINDHPVHTETGDGLLVSTPTGSTAYNLSSGGPILEPDINAIVLTPICPNYLNSRPVVIAGQSSVEIRVPTGRGKRILVGCDGQRELVLEEGDIAIIRKHPQQWVLLHPENYEYFSLLRSKLKWGMGALTASQTAKP